MSGPTNAVVGENDEPTKLPETQVSDEDLLEEKKLAQYSQTAEFKRLREFMEARIKFYQNYLPNGSRIQGDPTTNGLSVSLPNGDLTANWIAACAIISEFENVLSTYERAREVVTDADRR